MKVTDIVIVPHVHWDREWYFTCEESQVLAVRDFGEVLDHLEQNPDYPSYVLDGQMAVVDEYMATVPGARDRVEKLVGEGRLQVGPWYTQTDEMVVGAEPIVRNLLFGMESASKLGEPMLVGYVPDSFGQSAQMPMILNQFGIPRSVFWRGQSQFCGTSANQFWWESKDGSRVLVNQMPLGYATGKYLSTDPEALKKRLSPLFAVWDEVSPTPCGILPNGHDQMPIQTNIDEVIDALHVAFPDRHFSLGSLDDELDRVEAAAEETELPVIHSEFLDGKRERVHRSIYSVRMDNKVVNTRVENRLTRVVEPLLAVAGEVGISTPRALVRQAWVPLLEGHAHDSMGGCCSDKVNAEVKSRLANAGERADLLSRYSERFITEAADLPFADRIGFFNMSTVPGTRTVRAEVLTNGNAFELVDEKGCVVPYEVIETHEVDPGLVDRQIVAAGHYDPFLATTVEFERDLPSVGYEVLGVRETAGERPQDIASSAKRTVRCGDYVVTVNDNGTLDVTTLKGTSYKGVFGLEVEGNDGDEYDFSAVRGGRTICSADVVSCEPTVIECKSTVSIDLSYAIEMPADISGWTDPTAPTLSLGVAMTIGLDRNSDVIDVRVTLDNQANDYRVRLLVPTGLASEVSYASNQFGRIARPVVDPGMEVWEQEHWSERPDAIFPFLDYVALSDKGRTAAVLTDSAREYEVVGEKYDTLAITLLSGVGTLGKPALLRRPGRPSGISLDTPDGECHGRIELRLGLVLADASLEEANLGTSAARWLTPIDSYQRFDYAPIQLSTPKSHVPARRGLVAQTNPALTPSVVKLAEDGSSVVARFFNETDVPQRLELEGRSVDAFLTLAETETEGSYDVAPASVVTVRLSRE